MTRAEPLYSGRRLHAASALLAVVALFGMHGLVAACVHDAMSDASSDMVAIGSMLTSVAATTPAASTHRASTPAGDRSHTATMCLVVLASLSLLVALLRSRTALRLLRPRLRRALSRDLAVRGPPGLHQLAVLRL